MIYSLLLQCFIVILYPRMRYNVTIQETLTKTVQVEANSVHDAELTVRQLYRDGRIVLYGDDYSDTKIYVDRDQTSLLT